MSADNYFTVRKAGPAWEVHMGFMSDLDDGRIADFLQATFKKEIDALHYAVSNYSEYGCIEEEL